MRRGVVTSAVLLTFALAMACAAERNQQQDVEKALDQANLPSVKVEVDADANLVHLSGSVDSMSDRSRAEEIANSAVGTSGRVLNELTVVGLNSETADDLDDDIQDVLDRMVDDDPTLRERDINFEVRNGAVTVKGEVRTPDEKNRVTQIVKAAPGVKDFANALEIHPEQ
jgi:osmotically-inducible protein OsmY